MDSTIPGSEQSDLSRALEIGRLVLEAEAPFGYAKGQARIDLAEMPGELADRAALGIWAKIILINRERLEETDGIVGFRVPSRAKGVDFVGVSHVQPSW
jgi:hypothetical protein